MSAIEARPLEGKTALVTGGSMHLGAVTARTLAELGASVAINFLPEEKEPAEVLQSLRPYGQPSYAVPGDLAQGAEVRRVVEQALRMLGGRIDILVNNAGPFNGQPFAELPESEWDRIMNVNLKAAYLAAQGVAPGMRQAGWGRIINMAAGSAYIRNHGVYGLAKGAVIQLTEALIRFQSEQRVPTGWEKDCQMFVADRLRGLNLELDVFEPSEVPGFTEHPAYWPGRDYRNRPNVVGIWRGANSKGAKSLMFSSHVDVVAGLEGGRFPPFGPVRQGDKLYGRGSNDMKGGLAASIMAVRCLQELGIRLQGDVYVESVVDEEMGGSNGTLARSPRRAARSSLRV